VLEDIDIDPVAAVATVVGPDVALRGGFRKFETTVLMTQDELLKALKKAHDVAYVAPGAAVHA
jgi:hypothetical protein